MKNCLGCEYHKIIHDPDPYDWFRDMDIAIVCTLSANEKRDEKSIYPTDRSLYKLVLGGIAYSSDVDNLKIPEWCPL